jgi:flagellar motor protein MotB
MRAHVVARHRRAAGANSDGHDYFASMTDLMLGLVFVFIIVLMAVALNLRQSAQIESPPAPAAAALLSDITEADLARRDLLNDIARILNNALPVTVDEANGSLQLGGDVLFPTGSADAYSDALPKLRLLAKALAQVLPCYAVAANAAAATSCDIRHKGRLDAVYIEGHTDTTPIHTARFQSNWDLSAARASETFKLLVATFPTLATLKNDHAESLIGVSGYGEYRPIDTAGTATALQRNRRIELRFIMATPSPNAVTGLLDRVKDERAR